jgi:fatty-acyl-CoA synthase
LVGLPDKRHGEELCAWIVTRPGETLSEDDIRAFCKGKIAPYKLPRYILCVTGVPMTTVTDMIQKFKSRDEMKNQLGLEEDLRD